MNPAGGTNRAMEVIWGQLDSTYIVMDLFAATPEFILFYQIINPQVTVPALN